MERRDFIQSAALFAGLAGLSQLQSGCASAANINNSTKNIMPQPMLLPPQAPLDHKGNMSIRVCVRNQMTGGVYSSVECAVAPKVMGPAPHLHKELDELMFVLEGTANVMVDGAFVEVPAGGWHLRPRGLMHTFFNASDKPLRFIDMYFNQPFEEFLEKVFFEYTPEKGYPFGSKERQKVMDQLNAQFGLVSAPNAGAERDAIIKKFGLK
jgi:mannose-6-phosphate isomerase-like protein (cupin superfamily)